jgi:GT2 family glycosyltransferase
MFLRIIMKGIHMSETPLVSVIIPTCDRPDYLDRALHSLEIQTRTDFEAVVVNDGETPVRAVLDKYAKTLRLTAVEHERKRSGLSAARNSGLEASQGKFITFLDDDDYFFESHVEVLSEALTISRGRMVYADALLAEQRDFGSGYETVSRRLPLSEEPDPAALAVRNLLPVLCAMIDRSALGVVGNFAPYLRGHEDWDLWQRMIRFFPFRHLPVITGEYTARLNAHSLSTNIETMRDTWIFCRRQGALHRAVPAVHDLDRVAGGASILLRGSDNPAAGVVLTPGALDAATAERLTAILPQLGKAQPILVLPDPVRAPEFVASLARHCAVKPCVVTTEGDVGRVFATGLGAAACSARILVFLEEDVLPKPGSIDALVAFLEAEPSVDIAGGIIERPNFEPVAGGKFNSRRELIFAAPPKDADRPWTVAAVPSLALAVRRDAFAEVGGFDTAFAPGHYADADLALRLAHAGRLARIVPEARFSWNRENLPLTQTPAGLIARRAFLDRHTPGSFDPKRLLDGADWSLRALPRPSDGVIPSFNFTLPPRLR